VSIDETDPVAVLKSVRASFKLHEGRSLVAYAVWASMVIHWACKAHDHIGDLFENIEDGGDLEFAVETILKLKKEFPQ
jgi:hypothetical protein